MKLQKIILLSFFNIILFSNAFTQEYLTKEEVQEYTAMTKTADGTYQVQMIDTRSIPTIPLNLIKTVEEKREENKIAYFYFKDNIRIKILSRKEIRTPNFKHLKKIIYLSSTEL